MRLLSTTNNKSADTFTYALLHHKPNSRPFLQRLVDHHFPNFHLEILVLDLKVLLKLRLRGTMQYHHLLGTQLLPDSLHYLGFLLLEFTLPQRTGSLHPKVLGLPARYVAN
jgi:hypothetical protein